MPIVHRSLLNSEAKIKSFTEEQENANTKKRLHMTYNYLKDLLACGESDEGRENQDISAAELQYFAIKKQKSGEFEQKQISKR